MSFFLSNQLVTSVAEKLSKEVPQMINIIYQIHFINVSTAFSTYS